MSRLSITYYVRSLYRETAQQLASSYKFNEIADLFYEHGVIDTPETPWPGVEGSKYSYALSKLANAQDQEAVLRAIPHIFYGSINDIDDDHVMETERIEWLLIKLGYNKTVESANEFIEIINYDPPSDLSSISLPSAKSGTSRIDPTGLPNILSELVHELNDNLDRHNINAAALLIRRILTLGSYIAMKKIGKENDLQGHQGELELNSVISICQQNFHIAPQVISRVLSAKWIGDSANHSYKVRITESDIETAVTGCRLYLSETDLYESDRAEAA